MDEPFAQQLKRVRTAKGLTLEGLAFRVQDLTRGGDEKGISRDGIAQLEGKPRRVPREGTILLLGRALGAEVGEFPAYDLARARRALDERAVGLDDALAAFSRVRALLDLDEAAAESDRQFG